MTALRVKIIMGIELCQLQAQWSLKKHYDSQCCYYQRSVQLTSLSAAVAALINLIVPMKKIVLKMKTVMMIKNILESPREIVGLF